MSLAEWATDLMKASVPFVPGGRSRDGLDCWGVVWLAHKEYYGNQLYSGTEEYEPHDIKNYEKLGSLVNKYLPGWSKVDKSQPGDVLLMRLRGRPIHVGLIISEGVMLHIEHGIELCVEKYGNTVWKNRIVGIYRFSSV